MSFTVGALEADGWTEWRDLRLRALADSPHSFGPTLDEENSRPDRWWEEIIGSTATHLRGDLWLARLDGAAVGMLFGRVDETYSTLEVGAMWVDPEFRNRGVGSMLVSTAHDWARGLGVGSASLWCRHDDGVIAFYQRHGFVPIGEKKPLRIGSPFDVVRMEALL